MIFVIIRTLEELVGVYTDVLFAEDRGLSPFLGITYLS